MQLHWNTAKLMESSDLKRVLIHLKVVSSSSSKKDLQNTVRQHLSEEHANKLQGAQQAVEQAEQANAQAHAENVLGKINSLEVSAALQHFNKLDITSLKTLLMHCKVPFVVGSQRKQVQQLVFENLPATERQKLQDARQQLVEAEATRNAAREVERQLHQAHEQAAAHQHTISAVFIRATRRIYKLQYTSMARGHNI